MSYIRMEQYNCRRVYGISSMRHEGKLGKCRHFNVIKFVGVLVLIGKSNKEEKYNILLYERVITSVGGKFCFEGTSWI